MRCGYEAGERKKLPEMIGTCGRKMEVKDIGITYTDLEVSICVGCVEDLKE